MELNYGLGRTGTVDVAIESDKISTANFTAAMVKVILQILLVVLLQ